MKNTFTILYTLIFGLFLNILAQERPPITIFNPQDYGAASQNWSISQSTDRNIYIANNNGLLEYNGSKWNVYPSPYQPILRSVKVVDNLIYTGSYHDFGYWKRDNLGVLNYTSLAQELNVELLEDEEFWNIIDIDNSILFQSLDRILIYNKSTKVISVVNIEAGFKISKLFKVGANFYFQLLNKGLYKIDSGKAILISDENVVKGNVIVNIYNRNNNLLILTQDNGFFEFKDQKLIPWNIAAKNNLANVSVYSSIQLKDKSYVLGTISDGVICLSTSGELVFHISQLSGLSNNTVLALYEDADNNIWLGLDNGVNCINMKSPYQFYIDNSGTIGSVYTSSIYNNMLYLGTNQGLFVKPLNSNTNFEFIEGTQGQVWFLDIIDNTLFCGHHSGTFTIKNKNAIKINNTWGTWLVKPVMGRDDLLVQGNYNGLSILHKQNNRWTLRNKIEGFDISSRYFDFLNTNEIHLNHGYKGVFKIQLNNELKKVISITKDTILKKSLNSSLIKHNGTLLYAINKGVYTYNASNKKYERDSLLSKLIDERNFTSAKLVSEKSTNTLWAFSSQGINYLTTSKLSGALKINNIAFPGDIRKDVVGFESVTPMGNQKYLFGSTSGYIVLDLTKIENKQPTVNIQQITVSKQKGANTLKLVDLQNESEFENIEHNIQFSYSIAEFSKTQKPEYQYKLDGIYDDWSEWTHDGTVFFENLPFGDYTFNVRGRVGNQTTNNTATYTFSIKRPWFLSNLAIVCYVLGIVLLSIFIHNVYKRYYRKQRERLLLKSQRELELRELENKQQLMRFRNDKLREDIENKNRELGISTMNLIKKNEFLSSIKKELENAEKDGKNIKNVIKIIDKNLNNTDDWNLFQEAFNNADKDFLKKIKALHPSLTSNDLRLCAYLRLNLSSKEIAPLLNISPRSVEVKRYRLRKKMDLPHESSLTDYILEI